MGFLRVYLSICVIAAHSESVFPWLCHSGREAVQIFFIVSGFYMQLILSGTKYKTAKAFYLSRMLRIYVPYFTALFIIFCTSVFFGLYSGNWLTLKSTMAGISGEGGISQGQAFCSLANVTVFFQDWVMFLEEDGNGSLKFTSDFWNNKVPLWHYLWIPQAWSVGLELTFYLFAPFLVWKTPGKAIFLIAGASLIARIICYVKLSWLHDPWVYRFFPFELLHFCYGMIGYRIMQANPRWFQKLREFGNLNQFRSSLAWYACIFSIGFFCVWMHCNITMLGKSYAESWVSGGGECFYLAALASWVLFIPAVFSLTQDNATDRAIGELSYPIYLLHFSVVLIASDCLGVPKAMHGEASTVITVAIATLLQVLLFMPFERVRQSYINRERAI